MFSGNYYQERDFFLMLCRNLKQEGYSEELDEAFSDGSSVNIRDSQ